VKFEALENFLEESEEGDWLTLRTQQGTYHGVVEETREYTNNQRNELKEIKEEHSKEVAKDYAVDLEAQGEPIKYTINHPFEDYQVEINPMTGITHVTLEQEKQKSTEDLHVENTYRTPPEILNQYNQEIEIYVVEPNKEEKKPAAPSN